AGFVPAGDDAKVLAGLGDGGARQSDTTVSGLDVAISLVHLESDGIADELGLGSGLSQRGTADAQFAQPLTALKHAPGNGDRARFVCAVTNRVALLAGCHALHKEAWSEISPSHAHPFLGHLDFTSRHLELATIIDRALQTRRQ